MFRSLLSLLCLLAAASLEVSPSATRPTQTSEIRAGEPLAETQPTEAPAQKPEIRAVEPPPGTQPTEAPAETQPTDAVQPSAAPPALSGENVTIASTLKDAFHKQLRREVNYSQEINGAIALLFGGVLVYNGAHFFRLAMVFVIGVTIYFTSEADLKARFQDTLPADQQHHTTIWMKVVALELAVLIGGICGDGTDFDGVKKLLGLCVGLMSFNSIQFDMLNSEQKWMQDAAQNNIFSLVLGTLVIGGCFWCMAEGSSYFIAILAPLGGCVLVSSSVWYWVSYFHAAAPHETIYWIDFVDGMSPKNPAIGMLPGEFQGMEINRLCSVGLAFLIFAVSAYLQVKWAKKEREESSETSHLCKDIRDFLFCVPMGSTDWVRRGPSSASTAGSFRRQTSPGRTPDL